MRLIDADDLSSISVDCDSRGRLVRINAPTVCDIDAIRREIEDLYIITNPASDPYDGGYYTALIDVRRIIDKHMKGEHDAT